MLKGPWGVGKTHFIKESMENKKSDESIPKFMYISLYGISSPSQIDDEIFKHSHPVLSSKTVKFGSQILKGLLKGAVKLDLDSKDSASLNLQIPSLSLQEYLHTSTDRVLIFDDLERCSLRPSEILGYINVFVEHQNQKVIIIANEEDITAQEDSEEGDRDRRYRDIKEKVVGRTMELRAELDDTIPSFIDSVRNDRARELCKTFVEDIISAPR